MSRRRDSNPGTARLQGGCHPPHQAPTSNYGDAASPSGCLQPLGLTSFRVTNDVTLPMERPAGAQRDLRFIQGRRVCGLRVRRRRS